MEFSSNGNVGNRIEKKKKQMGERKNIKKKIAMDFKRNS